MKNRNYELLLTKILIIFFCIQPFLDVYYLYTLENIENVFVFSPSTIIRILFLMIFIYLSFKIMISDKKITKKIFIYFSFIAVYFVLHIINAYFFNSSILTPDKFSLISEIFYFIKMSYPLLMIAIIYKSNFTKRELYNTLFFISLIYGGCIFLTNIFLVGLPAYDGVNNISANFFSWFNGANKIYTYQQLTSKGFFHMANQVSALLLMIFPILIYSLHNNFKIYKLLIIIIQIISMFILGTRVASYGVILVIITCLLLYLGLIILKIEKFEVKKLILYLLIISFSITIYIFSPIRNRYFVATLDTIDHGKIKETKVKETLEYINDNETKAYNSSLKNSASIIAIKSENKKTEENSEGNDADEIIKKKIEFVKYQSTFFLIRQVFTLEIYPVEKNYDFWINVFNLPESERNTDRKIQMLIIEDVLKKNSNSADILLGISSSRVRNNRLYVERDFIIHYYMLGGLGVILLFSPYFLILVKAALKILKKYKTLFKYENLILLLSVCLCLISGYTSGNVMDDLIVTIFLALICAQLLKVVD